MAKDNEGQLTTGSSHGFCLHVVGKQMSFIKAGDPFCHEMIFFLSFFLLSFLNTGYCGWLDGDSNEKAGFKGSHSKLVLCKVGQGR